MSLVLDNHHLYRICVQCNQKYNIKDNDKCLFHANEYDSMYKQYSCCNLKSPCQVSIHKETHHDDYPYEAFFLYANEIIRYSKKTIATWIRLVDKDLNSDEESLIEIGKLLRFKENDDEIKENLLLVRVGRLVYKKNYLFKIYSLKDIEEIGRLETKFLYRSNKDSNSIANIDLMIENKEIKGMRVEVKSETSNKSTISNVFFISSLKENRLELIRVEKIRKGGIELKTPLSPYIVEDKILYNGYRFNDDDLVIKKGREFKTGGDIKMIVKMKKIEVNCIIRESSDYFEIELLYMNTSEKRICIKNLNVTWKLKGDKDWKAISSIESKLKGMIIIDLSSVISDSYKIFIEDKEKTDRKIRLSNRSWLARIRPIRFKFMYEDIFERRGYQIIEYVNNPPFIPKKYESDLLSLNVDNPEMMSRYIVKVEKGDKENGILFKIDFDDYTEEIINKIVYKGLKNYEYEYLVKSVVYDDYYSYDIYFLIDSSCKRAYALKIIIQNQFSSSLGYFPIPLYSISDDEEEKAEICLVKEKVILPYKEYALINDVVDYEIGETGIFDETETKTKNTENSKQKKEEKVERNDLIIEYVKSLDSKIERIANSIEKIISIIEI